MLPLHQLRLPQALYEQGCECDLDGVERQEWDDALRESDGEGDVHEVHIPEGAEGVADEDAQDHGADQSPGGSGAGGDETDDACAEDVADDVAAGRTGDHMQTAGKSREDGDADTAKQNIDDLCDHAVPETQAASGQQDAEYGQIDRNAGRKRNGDL